MLRLSTGTVDPYGTTRASTLFNSSGGTLELTQTIAISGSVWTAFSVYLRSSQGNGVTLNRTDGSTTSAVPAKISSLWSRFTLSTVFASSVSTTCDFWISIPSGISVDIFGPQVDPQPMPGTYVMSTAETGVYPNARFASDQLTITATGPNQNSATFSVFSKASQ